MQKGIATLEIILVTIIIAVIMKVAIPNAARLIDVISFDYEIKKLYSELRFVQSAGRSGSISIKGMGNGNPNMIKDNYMKITLIIAPGGKSYQVFRLNTNTSQKTALREPHYLAEGITLDSPEDKIYFDYASKANINSDHLTLKSAQLKKECRIVLNSLGRIKPEK